MMTLYLFVNPLKSLRNENMSLSPLEDVIKEILKQTVECIVFIKDYSDHSFSGDYA
jgi:hypothetical protein